MALADLILFPFVPQELYDEYKNSRKVAVKDVKSLSTKLKELFNASVTGDKLSQLILFDFYLSINNRNVYKDNITGKRLEQRLSKLFALSTSDELRKQNPKIETLLTPVEILNFDQDVIDLICSNYRDKGDLVFFNSKENSIYKLSIKSLVPENKEINFGAFEIHSTFKGIDGIDVLLSLQERNRGINFEFNGTQYKDIGLGSSTKMKQIINYIKAKNKIQEYLIRFEILLKGVYKDDFLIYIKDNERFAIYLLENKDFIKIILEKVKNGFENIRVEGNAIRVTDLKIFKQYSINKFEYLITDAIPSFNKIESLFLLSDQNKLFSFRKFISNK